ncbi:MAG: hypothetical protein CAK90_03365 [Spartobacteria bacterium AMD-G4]|nr:MAG: hypothetical protein CAK90_03365 [Spartobacteria bacterium AMD-G4]
MVAFAATPLFAGTGKTFKETVVVEEEESSWYNAALSTGWDSLYMFRGVNVLRGNDNYGSGLYWTDASFTWNITDNDFLTVGSWVAFGTQNAAAGYKEFDAYTKYTHTIGDLSLGLGYTFYYVFSEPELYSNELNASVAYAFDLGGVTITPSATYFFNLGPDFADLEDQSGIAAIASSYLQFRVDASVPIYKEVVSLAPWVGFGLNFDYNTRKNSDDSVTQFNGANNLEFGLAVPIAINDMITVSGYGAYSYGFYDLGGLTEPSTFWGGAKVTFAF